MENQLAHRRDDDDLGVGSGSDRISRLPEPVLHHILCFLSPKKAVQTCLLSKSWRHLGSTRPAIDLRGACDVFHASGNKFCEKCFYGNNEALLSVVEKTFRRYHHHNLSAKELRLQMLEVDSKLNSFLQKWIPIYIKPNSRVTTFHLAVDNYINNPDQKLYTWTFLDLPSAVFKAESLENLYLHSCKISSIEKVVLTNLKKLTLSRVYVDDEALRKIMSGCPLVEYANLHNCKGLKTFSVANENRYLKDFTYYGIDLHVIDIDVPTVESIRIEGCPNWKLNSSNCFPHLKSLYLYFVKLSTESFENFSRNSPLLEEFTLYYCHGFYEIKLFSPSLKHLSMRLISSIKLVDIDAPNIQCFKFSGCSFPSIISFTTTSREWKSEITLNKLDFPFGDALQRFCKLNEMLKAVRQSQISLDISECIFHDSKLIECGIHDPHVVVENLEISETRSNFNPVPCLFYDLFQICRPRYVTTRYGLKCSNYDEGWTGELVDCMRDVLVHEREKKEYYWQQHLEEVSIETFNSGESVWHRVQGTCLPECALNHRKIRFRLKWRA